ncbi:MAG: PEP-CTERM sorting domain-containing protein [Pseudomonadota bacterium]
MLAFAWNRSALLGCVVATSCVLLASPAIAAPNFYSTGTHISGVLDTDWWVSTGYGSFNTANFVQANTWVHGSEAWISDTDYSAPVTKPQDQYFTFRQYFDLTGYDASSANLQFYWGADDIPGAVGFMPQFSINGGAFQGSGTATGYAIGSNLVDLSSGFVSGMNYIDFRVQGNYATNGMGLRVVSFTAAVPEPETYAMLLAGLGLVGLRLGNRQSRMQQVA